MLSLQLLVILVQYSIMRQSKQSSSSR